MTRETRGSVGAGLLAGAVVVGTDRAVRVEGGGVVGTAASIVVGASVAAGVEVVVADSTADVAEGVVVARAGSGTVGAASSWPPPPHPAVVAARVAMTSATATRVATRWRLKGGCPPRVMARV